MCFLKKLNEKLCTFAENHLYQLPFSTYPFREATNLAFTHYPKTLPNFSPLRLLSRSFSLSRTYTYIQKHASFKRRRQKPSLHIINPFFASHKLDGATRVAAKSLSVRCQKAFLEQERVGVTSKKCIAFIAASASDD